jgi:hypothetical protein
MMFASDTLFRSEICPVSDRTRLDLLNLETQELLTLPDRSAHNLDREHLPFISPGNVNR